MKGQLRVSDGTRLAYRLTGVERGPTVALLDGISCAGFIFRHLEPHLAQRARVLHVHYRGHGRSGLPRAAGACTLPHLARDLDEVMGRLGLGPAVLIGHSMGVQVALEVAWRYPARVTGQVLMCGSHGRVLDTFKHTDLGAQLLPTLDRFTRRYRGAVSRAVRAVLPTGLTYLLAVASEIKGEHVRKADFMPYLEHFARMPLDLFMATLEDASHRRSLPFLGHLDVPSLVVTGAEDSFTPVRQSRELAEALPDAELDVIEGASHVGPLERPGAFVASIDGFLRRRGLLVRPSPTRAPVGSWIARWASAQSR